MQPNLPGFRFLLKHKDPILRVKKINKKLFEFQRKKLKTTICLILQLHLEIVLNYFNIRNFHNQNVLRIQNLQNFAFREHELS